MKMLWMMQWMPETWQATPKGNKHACYELPLRSWSGTMPGQTFKTEATLGKLPRLRQAFKQPAATVSLQAPRNLLPQLAQAPHITPTTRNLSKGPIREWQPFGASCPPPASLGWGRQHVGGG